MSSKNVSIYACNWTELTICVVQFTRDFLRKKRR